MIDMDEVEKYNYRNAVHLLRENCRDNLIEPMSRSEYRFLLCEGLIKRNINHKSGRIYVLTVRGMTELVK